MIWLITLLVLVGFLVYYFFLRCKHEWVNETHGISICINCGKYKGGD